MGWGEPCTALSPQHTLFQTTGLPPNMQPPILNSRLIAVVARSVPETSVPKCMGFICCQELLEKPSHSALPFLIHYRLGHLADTALQSKACYYPRKPQHPRDEPSNTMVS